MSEYDGEVQLGVKLKPQDIQASAQKLSKTISSIFDANAGKKLDSSFKRIMATMDKNNTKATNLNKTIDELSKKYIPTDQFQKLINESNRLEDAIAKVKKEMASMEKAGKVDTTPYRNRQRNLASMQEQLGKITRQMYDLEQADMHMQLDPTVVPELEKATQALHELNNAQRVEISKWDEMAAKSGQVVSSISAMGSSTESAITDFEKLGEAIIKTTQEMLRARDAEEAMNSSTGQTGNYAERAAAQWGNSFGLIRQSVQDIPNLVRMVPGAVQSAFSTAKKQMNEFAQGVGSGLVAGFKKAGNAAKNLATTINGKLKSGLKSLTEHFKSVSKQANKASGSMGLSFKNLIKYGLGISSLFVLINKLRTAIKDGLTEMAKMNGGANETNKAISELSSSFSAFKNSIAAAVSPLVNLLAPALARIVDLATRAMNAVAAFIAALTGKTVFTKAVKTQKDFATGLDKTGKAAKKANKELQQLAGFDELNLLSKKDEDDGGGSGGGAGAGFEEVPIDPKILDWANKLKDIWSKIWDYIKKLGEAFKSGFWEAMGDWQSKVADIKKNLGIIWDALKEIATDPDVVAAADRWAQSFAHMLGTTAGMFASIGLTIAQNLIGGIAKFLASNKEDIKQYLIDMFDIGTVINDQIAAFEVAIARIFDVFGQENGQQLTANILGIFWELFSNIRLLAAKLGRDILILITQPIIDNVDGFKQAFDGILGVLASVAGSIKYTLDSALGHFNDMYDAHIKPFFDNLTSELSHLVSVILEMWNTYIKPVLDDWGLRINNLLTEHIRPAINTATDLIGSIVDLLSTVLGPIILKLQIMIQGAIAILVPIVQNMGRVFIEVIGMMADWIGNFLTIFKDVIDVIVALLNGDWASAWESAQKLFEDVWTAIKDFFKSIVNTIISIAEGLINTIIGIVNKACDMIAEALGGLSFDVPDWVPGIGGNSLNIKTSVPHISEVHFPRLAQGAVIPPNKEFMAVLGDQKNGTNIETPLDTMIEAFNAAKGDEESLLREQNSILRQLLEKEWNIGTKDIFDAARKENVNFVNRTGRSAFAY